MNNVILMITIAFFTILGKSYGQYCTTDTRYTEAEFFKTSELQLKKDIQYGTAPDRLGNPHSLLMDIYYPNLTVDTSPKRPFIMVFHGGAFKEGDKQQGDIKDLCIHFAKRGYVCASVGYRLGHDLSEYDQYKARYRAIQDGHAALRYIVDNANTYKIDTNWVFVGGQSAGSLLSQGMVYSDQSELDSISLLYNPIAISTALGKLTTSGNNLTNTCTIKGIFNNWGAVPSNEIDKDEMIPTIAFHGEVDTIVYIDEKSLAHFTMNGSRKIHNDLLANNVCSELTVDPAGDHGIYRNELSVFRAQRASCFFKSIFCNSCSNFYATKTTPANCSTTLSADEYTFESNNIEVYPNPFQNSFIIKGMGGTLDIKIYNSFGQLVVKEEINSGEIQADLIPGLYFLHIKHVESNTSYTTKLIKT
jgi:alpha/beta hydrolase fold/Secretion system C-terminal sorting domain